MPLFYNRVMLAGNLTRDPQVKFLANESAVAEFGLAINRRYRGQHGEQKEETTFVDVECWGRTAELVGQYLTKGRNCFIEGSLKLNQWEDRDGNKRSKLKVIASNVQFIGSSGADGDARQKDQPERHMPEAQEDLGDDEPPF
jgi:single-strand DNA-binding protein